MLESLRAQTACDRLELVIVSLTGEPLGLNAADVNGFAGFRLIEGGEPMPLAIGRAAGVRASSARFVHVGETHSFPRPEWAERMIEALGDGSTAIVPGLENDNPVGAISWANFVIDYGTWFTGQPGGEILRIPAYNTTFERSSIVALLDREPDAFEPGIEIASVFRHEHRRITLHPEAIVDHVNLSRWRGWLRQRCLQGRTRAAVRCRTWSRPRRLAYALGSPLIPIVLAARVGGPFFLVSRSRRVPPGTAPMIVVSLVAQSLGELAGFALGTSDEVLAVVDQFEIDRLKYAVGEL